MINSIWNREIVRAITKTFSSSPPITFYKEGGADPRSSEPEWMQLRITGPNITELAGSDFVATVNIDILLQSEIKEADVYRNEDLAGQIAAQFLDCITVLESDNITVIGQLQLVADSDGTDIITTQFGKDKDHTVMYTSISGDYRMSF